MRQWLKVELLVSHGERFSEGGTRLGVECRTLATTVAYLSKAHPGTKVREDLATVRRTRTSQRPEK